MHHVVTTGDEHIKQEQRGEARERFLRVFSSLSFFFFLSSTFEERGKSLQNADQAG